MAVTTDYLNELINQTNNTMEFTLLCDADVAYKRAKEDGHERNKYDTMPLEKYKKINDAYRELYKTSYGIRCMLDTSFITQDGVFNKLVEGIDSIISGCEIDEE